MDFFRKKNATKIMWIHIIIKFYEITLLKISSCYIEIELVGLFIIRFSFTFSTDWRDFNIDFINSSVLISSLNKEYIDFWICSFLSGTIDLVTFFFNLPSCRFTTCSFIESSSYKNFISYLDLDSLFSFYKF